MLNIHKVVKIYITSLLFFPLTIFALSCHESIAQINADITKNKTDNNMLTQRAFP